MGIARDLIRDIILEGGERSDALGETINAYMRQFADRTLPELGVLLQRTKDRIAEAEDALINSSHHKEAIKESYKRRLVGLEAKSTAICALIDLDERGLRKNEIVIRTETLRQHCETVVAAHEEHYRSITSMTDLIRYAGETPVKKAQEVLRDVEVSYEHRNPEDFVKALEQVLEKDANR